MLFVLGFVLYGSMALLPIFLQTLLGYTASLSGWVLSPGGVAVLVMMPVVAILMKHIEARWLIAFGFITCGIGLFMMAGFNLQVDFQSAMMARMVQSAGLAFLFIPINVTAFQSVSPDKTNYATGLLNLVRNIGGSTGIALVTTILSRRAQVHQANLVGNMVPASAQYQSFLSGTTRLLVSKGDSLVDAAHKAQGMAYGMLLRQSTMMAFVDTFWVMGLLCICLLPLLLLMKKPRTPKSVDPASALH
jgi:DHA2 family multidrug resistance protein